MKVLAVKGIEKDSINNLWVVRYTRMYGKHVQDAVFACRTEEEAKHKYEELLDILINHDGLYIGSKEKRKVKKMNSSQGARKERLIS
jgi:CRISPR/Cas system-associated endoribonuclease Cas2